MKHYLYSVVFIICAIIVVNSIPILIDSTEDILLSLQIPQNNAQIAGVQKYNLPPVSLNIPPPYIFARAMLIKDLATDEVLYQKDANLKLAVGSLTKIMTALVGVEYFRPNSVLIYQGTQISGTRIGLVKGESLTFRALLFGMLLPSGNDAAYTIAQNYAGGEKEFINKMNEKAVSLSLKNSHFDNPAGFDSADHFSTAEDIAKITQEALKDSQLKRIFATKETEVLSLDKKYQHKLQNLNKLLSEVIGVLGVKTGTTPQSKENLVTLVEREGHQVLIVLLGSDDRFEETKQIIEWVFNNFIWPAQ